jgi:exosortase
MSRETSLSQTTHISSMLEYPAEKTTDKLLGLSLRAWVQIITVTVLMCALFRVNLVRLWGKTNPINGQDMNWQHAIFVPLIGIYYLYIHREELLRAAGQPERHELGIRILAAIGLAIMAMLALALIVSGDVGFNLMLVGVLGAGLAIPVAVPRARHLGMVLMFEGLIVFVYGIFPGYNDYVKDLGMVITLFGVATLLCGWDVMKVAWFPIVFLVVALPWPELVYAKLAWPLQQLAASVAVGALRICGVEAQNFGTRIRMVGENGQARVLNVAEACAGLKSVMTFLMVAGTVAFLSSRVLWEKALIALSAIPIAIFCNVLRVTGQGILDFYWSHEISEGFAHQFVGLVMIIPGFFLILLVGWLLDKIFIEEVDRRKLAGAGAGAKGSSPAPARPSKRMIVEVPRKKEAEIPASGSEVKPAATANVLAAPVAPPTVAPAVAKAPPPARVAPPSTSTKPPAPKPPTAPPAALKSSSTLKPSPVKPRPPVSGSTPQSTLKPSSRPPVAPKPPAAAPGSTLKPSAAPKPPPQAPPKRGPAQDEGGQKS